MFLIQWWWWRQKCKMMINSLVCYEGSCIFIQCSGIFYCKMPLAFSPRPNTFLASRQGDKTPTLENGKQLKVKWARPRPKIITAPQPLFFSKKTGGCNHELPVLAHVHTHLWLHCDAHYTVNQKTFIKLLPSSSQIQLKDLPLFAISTRISTQSPLHLHWRFWKMI